ncbi:MAG TPA: NnrS family protein [Bryobacterales bacterium]|nr:NnrS family protein [Bryobacterales bacterium]
MNRPDNKPAAGYWSLVAGEPFRLLFPLGTVIGILGVLMWPLFFWHVTATYPGQMHARVMIEGYLTCFVAGFLGTALPRLLDVPRLTLAETFGIAIALAGATALHLSRMALWGDLLFSAGMGMFVLSLVLRLPKRRDVPPPAFVLVGLGLACALAGAGSQIVFQISMTALPAWVVHFGRLLLHQGYILLPVMGVGAFILPRFFGLPSRQAFPESLALPPGWLPRAGFAVACGAAVLASFGLESAGMLRWAFALRATAVTVYFLREIPAHRSAFRGGSLALGLRIALFSIPAGYAAMAVLPQWAGALSHVVFISGFSLLTFVVASRVVLGHSGQSAKFSASLRPVWILSSLLVVAMLTRVSADWMPLVRTSHYAYAALAWAVGVVIWAATILPSVRIPDSEE